LFNRLGKAAGFIQHEITLTAIVFVFNQFFVISKVCEKLYITFCIAFKHLYVSSLNL
jgi:hypothetical protein